LKSQDERIVIRRKRAGPVAGVRSKHLNLGRSKLEMVTGNVVFDHRANRLSLSQKCVVSLGVGVVPDPNLAGSKVSKHGRHTPDVIGVCVGESNRVETATFTFLGIGAVFAATGFALYTAGQWKMTVHHKRHPDEPLPPLSGF